MQPADLGLTVVSTTYETQKGQRLYRITENEFGIVIRRLSADERCGWSHGTLVQVYTGNAQKEFVTRCVGVPAKVATLADAVKIIDQIQEN